MISVMEIVLRWDFLTPWQTWKLVIGLGLVKKKQHVFAIKIEKQAPVFVS